MNIFVRHKQIVNFLFRLNRKVSKPKERKIVEEENVKTNEKWQQYTICC